MSLERKPWGLPYIASLSFFQVLTTSSPIYIPTFIPMNCQFFLNFLGLQNIINGWLKDIDVYWKDREKRHLWIVSCFLFDQRSRIVKLFIILRDKQGNRRNHPQWVEVIPKEHSYYFSSTFNSTRYSENEIHSSKNGRNFQVKSDIRKKL